MERRTGSPSGGSCGGRCSCAGGGIQGPCGGMLRESDARVVINGFRCGDEDDPGVRPEAAAGLLDEPLADGADTPGATRDNIAVKIWTDDGLEGIGTTFFGGPLSGAPWKAP